MRTTLDIDDDVLHAAKDLARRERKSIGFVISELARRALVAPATAVTARSPRATYGVQPFEKRGGLVTNELVNRLRDDDAY